jgi:hypothetical protein
MGLFIYKLGKVVGLATALFLILLPSRSTPYLAPAAGAIISATALARASGVRAWLTERFSADRSVPQVQTPIQGTRKPKRSRKPSSSDAIDGVECRVVAGVPPPMLGAA